MNIFAFLVASFILFQAISAQAPDYAVFNNDVNFKGNATTCLKCGNLRCESWLNESCVNCPRDCGPCPSCDNICGNQRCEASESACNCPQDCGVCCVDGFCRGKENAINCPKDCTTDLVGWVYDVVAVKGVPGAQVQCQSADGKLTTPFVQTSADGGFTFSKLPGGVYTCSATFPGYYPAAASVDFKAGLQVEPVPDFRIPLVGQFGSITGELRDAVFGGYLRAVNVTCTFPLPPAPNSPSVRYYNKITSQSYFFYCLKSGTYNCTATKPGYFPASANAQVTIGQNTVLHLNLVPRNTTWNVTLTNSRNKLPLNGTVSCQGRFPKAHSVTANVANGNSLVSLFPEVDYQCLFVSPTFLNKTVTVAACASGTVVTSAVKLSPARA